MIAILIFSTAVTIMSTDLYTSSMPHLSKYFGTTPEKVSLTLSLAIIAFAISQLTHGPLSDRFGRRPILLYGMIGFTIFTVACAFSKSIEALILFRILQAVCGSVEAVIVLAVIGDLFYEKEGVKVLGIYGMVVAAAPAIAPIVGGYMFETFGWQSNFFLLAVFGFLLIIFIYFFLPETITSQSDSLHIKNILNKYYQLIINRIFIIYTLILSIFFACMWAFIAGGPFLFINYLGIETKYYGFFQMIIVISFFAGSIMANATVEKLGPEKVLRIGIFAGLIGSLFLSISSFLQIKSEWIITMIVCVVTFGLGPVFAVGPIRALSQVPTTSIGSAAALRGTIQLFGAGLGALPVGLIQVGNTWPMAVTMSFFSLMGVLIYTLFKPWEKIPSHLK
ncbi:multidrug effflux MFS transporter [Leptospira santarosai]|uniref:multidrug effflux MFS transporter n=3 Tax=Leptospira santarosai TaxID=28183 RepID=UPI0022A7DCA1|nr:multidrug effflux MFS transporter [Leptospira santarosai]